MNKKEISKKDSLRNNILDDLDFSLRMIKDLEKELFKLNILTPSKKEDLRFCESNIKTAINKIKRFI